MEEDSSTQTKKSRRLKYKNYAATETPTLEVAPCPPPLWLAGATPLSRKRETLVNNSRCEVEPHWICHATN